MRDFLYGGLMAKKEMKLIGYAVAKKGAVGIIVAFRTKEEAERKLKEVGK